MAHEPDAARLRNAEILSEECLRRCGAEANKNPRTNDCDLCLEPRHACANLTGSRLLMYATLAARFPFEVLYGIRDVSLVSIDTRIDERFIKESSRRSDKRVTCDILFIARLLLDALH